MSEYRIRDAEEEPTGKHSLEVIEDGETVVETHFNTDLFPDFEDLNDIRGFLHELDEALAHLKNGGL